VDKRAGRGCQTPLKDYCESPEVGGGEENGRISSQELGKQVPSSFTKSHLPIFLSSTNVQKLNNSSLMNEALLFLDLSNVVYVYIIANTVFSVLLALRVKMELHAYFFCSTAKFV